MRSHLADIAHLVIHCVISLQDRLAAGEPLQWEQERNELVRVVLNLNSPRDIDLQQAGPIVLDEESTDFGNSATLTEATVRLALVAWIDEIAQHYHWGGRWREAPLAVEICGVPNAEIKFWDEARYAETRGDPESLEVMQFCVLLGFRGALRDKAEQLETWNRRVTDLLEQAVQPRIQAAALQPSPGAAEELAERRDRQMLMSTLMAASMVVPLVMTFLWRFWHA